MATVVRTFEQLAAFFDRERIPHRVDRAQQLVEIPGRGGLLPGHLVLKWAQSAPFLQLIHAVIENVPADRVRDVASAIALLNDRLEVGGFGWSSTTCSIYFRVSVPMFASDGINPSILPTLGQGVVANAKAFLAALQCVVDGARGEAIVDLYESSRDTEASGSDA